jgi:hypothetical protein
MAPPPTQQQRDAHAILRETFARYGLGGTALATWALDGIIAGKGIEQILLELEERPEYKAAFPEIEARRIKSAETGIQLSPISPAEILEYRTQAKALMASYGLPSNFYGSNSDFYDLIVGDTSMSELNDRLEAAARRVVQAPPEVRSAFTEIYGHAGDQALFTLFTDVERSLPSLQEMVQTAEAGGAARRFGFGLTGAQAQLMAAYNIDYDEAVQGFGQLYKERGLFDETLNESEDFTVGEQGIAAAFGLEGQEALQKRGEARAAATAGFAGGGFSDIGALGLGTADQPTSR